MHSHALPAARSSAVRLLPQLALGPPGGAPVRSRASPVETGGEQVGDVCLTSRRLTVESWWKDTLRRHT